MSKIVRARLFSKKLLDFLFYQSASVNPVLDSITPQAIANSFSAILAPVKDHRRTSKGNIQYSIDEIFFFTLAGVISGCDSWEAIALFGKYKIEWFRNFFPYRKGTPSADTLERFYAKLSKETFGEFFIRWASSHLQSLDNEVVSIDGKRLRGSYDKSNEQAALHIVSAYASANRLTLGQVATEEKSNEITAIPQLLDLIEVKDTVVSIDAMGCQKEIVKKIREKQAHYLIAAKENQKELTRNIQQSFDLLAVKDSHVWMDKGHGRIENRTCEIIDSLDWMETKEEWKDLRTLIRIRSERTIITTGEAQSQIRYYISSKIADAQTFNKIVRSHWAIENNLHWVLDVTFKEDASRRRKGNSAYNFNIIAKIALKLIDQHKEKRTRASTRMVASASDEFRTLIFKGF